jgi:hypothetical protein
MITPLVRQLTIAMITEEPNEIIDWFNALLSKLIVLQTDVFHPEGEELIYYIMVEGARQFIFYRDDANGKFLCDYYTYWLPYVLKHDLDTEVIEAITKFLVDNALGADIATPSRLLPNPNGLIELVLQNTV